FLEEIANQDFIIPSANRILNNEFGFLGINPKTLKEINWQQDIRSSHIWPNDFYLDLRESIAKDYLKQTGWDIRYVWELSRFHYLIPLALAYYKTGEEKYLNKWQELIEDWIKNNPVYYGPNWVIAMEVAIRACNWILSWQIVQMRLISTTFRSRLKALNARNDNQKSLRGVNEVSNEAISKDFVEKFLASLYEHGRFIYSNLEYAPIRSNHYLTDVVGLIYLGSFFKNNRESQRWLDYGKKALEAEMKYQVLSDGVDYELSVSYHRYKTELFLWAAYILKNNKINLSYDFWLKLSKMMNFSLAITKPNNLAPQIGDSDDSRLHLVWENYYSWEKRNYNALIKLFELVSNKPLDNYPLNSQSFSQSGFYLLKDNGFYLITGRHQACYGKGGSHIHNDILSFELSILGEDLVIDPGTYLYTSNYKERNKFRGTQAHNTVMIDNQEQNPLAQDPFYFEQRAQMKVIKWEEQKDFILLEADHTGYRYLKQPIIHRRNFLWDKKAKSLLITDKFKGKGKHLLEWNFHLAPKIQVWLKKEKKDRREIILISNKHSFLLAGPQELNCVIIDDEVSPSYGVKIPAKTIRFSGFFDQNSSNEFKFKIEPIK
ncbi:MAG: alginate lyase family protein, partial [Minisyncoccia bacterium]